MIVRRIAIMVLAALALGACGLKGDLVVPDPAAPATPAEAPAQPAPPG